MAVLGSRLVYVASVIDLANRRVVGWAMADHTRAELACDALAMAIASRQPPPGLIFHTDRGSQLRFKGSSQHRLVPERVGVR